MSASIKTKPRLSDPQKTAKRIKYADTFLHPDDRVVCPKCSGVFRDLEPYGAPEFYHYPDLKRHCENDGQNIDTEARPATKYMRKGARRNAARVAKKYKVRV